MESFKLDIDQKSTKKNCKGQVFKAHVSQYSTKRGFASTVRFDNMKRLSCPGCKFCGWVDDAMTESEKGPR